MSAVDDRKTALLGNHEIELRGATYNYGPVAGGGVDC
jgi:hypothetical protein